MRVAGPCERIAFWLFSVATLATAAACGSNDLQPIQGPPEAGPDVVSPGHDGGKTPGEGDADTGPTGPVDSGGPRPDGGGKASCKRGIATNAAPSTGFTPSASSPGVSWWYNWSAASPGATPGIEFVPMIWGAGSLSDTLPAGSKYVLGFNEPNFVAQSNLTPSQAAADWPMIEANAKAAGVPIVSPGVNFCGSPTDTTGCSDPSVTDPYTYLKDFFADCPGCEVDYVAVHWYNCDLPSLEAYLEGNLDAGGTLQGFVQFGKPIWLTEFSCGPSSSVADQTTYMQAAVPYLESNPHVFRYSWFSASGIPTAELANADGSLTALGMTNVGLPQTCP
jgi:hypothetical protein